MIYMITSNSTGSAKELGTNLASALNQYYPSQTIKHRKEERYDISNSIIIFIKRCLLSYDQLNALKNRNNTIYYFVVDDYIYEKRDFHFDGIIFSNQQQKEDFSKYLSYDTSCIYYHHWSPDYKYSVYDNRKDIGYFTGKVNVCNWLLKNTKVDSYIEDFNYYKNYICDYKFHIEYRRNSTNDFYYKPCAKLSTSTFAESVFICSEDSSYKELLPQDYPYFLTDIAAQTEFNNKLEYYISTYDQSQYYYALDIMRNLKNQLDIKNTSKLLFQHLSTHHL